MKSEKNDTPASESQENYTWPRTLPLWVRPHQPPVRTTGGAPACPEETPESRRICKRVSFQDCQEPSVKFKKLRKKSESNLMRRSKILEHPARNTYKTRMPDRERLQSTYQVGFTNENQSYGDHSMAEACKPTSTTSLECSTDKPCKKIIKIYLDPLPFKKNVDKGPLLS